ncbi:hypothetical protein HAX54_014150, partial [Datura stramonium]|nr:hypothetical protein [Datura stramonium]
NGVLLTLPSSNIRNAGWNRWGEGLVVDSSCGMGIDDPDFLLNRDGNFFGISLAMGMPLLSVD